MAWIPRERIWPTLVVVALVGNVGLGLTLARIAGNDPSFAVEPDYYAKAMAWDSIVAQREQNADLGWQVTPTLPAIVAGTDGPLTLELRDRDGRPVRGARVHLEAMPVARASRVVTAVLRDSAAAGVYAGAVAVDRPGLWEFRITAVRDTDRFTVNLRLDASATASATVVTERPGDPAPPPRLE